MVSARIVKLAQEDSDEPILIHISSKGHSELDLDIVGTEGEKVYKAKGPSQPLLVPHCHILLIKDSQEKKDS